jgi:hypothetical protein
VTIRTAPGLSHRPAAMLRGGQTARTARPARTPSPLDPKPLDPKPMRREDLAYLPLVIVLSLPVLACLLLMLVEPGINRSLLFSAVKTGVILIVIGGALCFAASKLAARGDSSS